METYIDRIKQLKSQKKITNEQLSARTGIPLGTLSKILAGMSDSPKLANMVAICDALGCSIEYIVSGTPDNINNYLLSDGEIRMMDQYRRLDRWGRELVAGVIRMELDRLADAGVEPVSEAPARILRPVTGGRRYADQRQRTGKRTIRLYELPVSAGVGEYLDDAASQTITVPNNEKTADADYALTISGNSMEPKYHNGDILLVQNCECVEVGEPGIFLLDGCGYFKVYGGDRLISLNPEYGPILLKDYGQVSCRGRVVGRLKRKASESV